MKCELCNRTGRGDGATLYRINEKGVAGKWACQEHIAKFPLRLPDAETVALADFINPHGAMKRAGK